MQKQSMMQKIWREIKRPFRKIQREIKRPFKQLGRCFKLFVREMAGFNEFSQQCHDLHNDLRNECHNLRQNIQNECHNLQHNLRRDLYQELTCFIQHSISTAVLHQNTFSKFKNIHQGQEIVLVACGPSAKDYRRIDHAIHIGVNRAFQLENIDLQYLFMQDYAAVKPFIKEANRYKPESCTKFYGIHEWEFKIIDGREIIIPESDAIEANAFRYRTDLDFNPDPHHPKFRFSYLIDSELLGNFCSIVFPAMQFALWTNPRTIYLVGCDCSEGYFDGQASQFNASHLVPLWTQLKEFARLHYPETKIISINPVGLKGVFEERETKEN